MGLGPLQSFSSFASARSSLLRQGPFKKEPRRSRTLRVRLSWGSCSRGHNDAGRPFSSTRSLAVVRVGRGSPDPRRCRPQGSRPSRRFQLARGSVRSLDLRGLLDLAVRRGPRRFAAFFHAARVPGAPLQSFPFPGSRTRSRGPRASLRVRCPTVAGAAPPRASRPLSPFRASPSPLAPARRRTRDS